VQSPSEITSGFNRLPALETMMRNLLERIQHT
jgi:hypothetical protein